MMKKLINNKKMKIKINKYLGVYSRYRTTYYEYIIAECVTYKWKDSIYTHIIYIYICSIRNDFEWKTLLYEERNVLLDRVITIRVGRLNVFTVYFSESMCTR